MMIEFDIPAHELKSKNRRDAYAAGGRHLRGVRAGHYKRFLREVGWRARFAMNTAGARTWTTPVFVEILYGTAAPRIVKDAQNIEEGLFDGLKGVVYLDDSLIWDHRNRRVFDREHVTVRVSDFQAGG